MMTMMRVLRQIEEILPHRDTVPCLRKAQELQRLQSADRDQEQERRDRAPVALQMLACGLRVIASSLQFSCQGDVRYLS